MLTFCKQLKSIYYSGNAEQWFYTLSKHSVEMPWTNAAFYLMDENNQYVQPTKIIIPQGAKEIPSRAFDVMKNIVSITIPQTVTKIGGNAFEYCENLKDIYYDGTIQQWMGISFDQKSSNPMIKAENFYILNENKEYVQPVEIDLSTSWTTIPDYIFYNFKSLKKIIIPNTVTSIGEYAFYGCHSLKDIIIPESVKSIGEYAFYQCAFESIKIPNGMTIIETNVFEFCFNLNTIILPNSIEIIKEGFPGNLENVYYDGTLKEWANITVSYYNGIKEYLNNLYVKDESDQWYQPTDLVIEPGTIEIGFATYAGIKSLKNVTIPSSVKKINNYAFENCVNLENVYYEGTIEQWLNIEIGEQGPTSPMEYATNFYMLNEEGDWYLLTELTLDIPNVKNGAFYNFECLKKVVITENVITMGRNIFYSCGDITIYCESVSKPSNWNEFWNYSNHPVIWGYKEK